VLLDPNLKNSGDVQKLGVVHSHATQRDARKTDFQYDLDPATALILAARIVDCNHYAINRRFANLFIDVTQLKKTSNVVVDVVCLNERCTGHVCNST
jgi:hypothetical protein